jgi:hypothetical protein
MKNRIKCNKTSQKRGGIITVSAERKKDEVIVVIRIQEFRILSRNAE